MMQTLFDIETPNFVPRDYQQDAFDATLRAWQDHQSTLVVLPTGMGKTCLFAMIADHMIRMTGKRVLVLAHMDTLIWQAADEIRAITGIEPEIEMGELRAGRRRWNSKIVISTRQSQASGRKAHRFEGFPPEDFGLIIIDEAHRSVSKQYRKIIAWYAQNPDCRILGVTATPNRHDAKSLGDVFTSTAYEMYYPAALDLGYLVPVEQYFATIHGLDYSTVHARGQDFVESELIDALEIPEVVHGMADAIVEKTAGATTLVFCASCQQARWITALLNSDQDRAVYIDGNTPKDDRRRIYADFQDRKFTHLVNVGVTTEGFNERTIKWVVVCRPFRSTLAYLQILGRGTRPLANVVDGLSTPAERRAAIAASDKPCMKILDFNGCNSQHKLVCSMDALGGERSQEVIDIARLIAERRESGISTEQAFALAESEVAARQKQREEAAERKRVAAERRRKLVADQRARADISLERWDPLCPWDIAPGTSVYDSGMKPPTPKMLEYLERYGTKDLDRLSYRAARDLIVEMKRRWREELCSVKQARVLRNYGENTESTRADAKRIIDAIAAARWPRPAEWKRMKAAQQTDIAEPVYADVVPPF